MNWEDFCIKFGLLTKHKMEAEINYRKDGKKDLQDTILKDVPVEHLNNLGKVKVEFNMDESTVTLSSTDAKSKQQLFSFVIDNEGTVTHSEIAQVESDIAK